VYNIATFLDGDNDFPGIIRDFEALGPSLKGELGTQPELVQEYFNVNGYKTQQINTKGLEPADFDHLLEQYDSFLLSDWNTTNAGDAMHTMAITVEKILMKVERQFILL